ncbi:hypothetical protein ACFPPA_14795 [Rhodanobacter ginsengisoli]|uniref:Uncharacterized protein n=2 Tax=Rhodanobacter ginsengisoli TaxID=418646 RepID=A0ABW0QS75_9GAMM
MALGKQLAAGKWLGIYSQFTLMKGPGYPLFLAINSWLGLPVGLSHAAFQCAAIALFFWVFARLASMPNLALCGFIFTLWAPAPYLERIMRDAIYPGETLLVLGTLCYALFAELPPKTRLKWALLSGLFTGWLALTREEGVWIAPGVTIIVLYGAWVAWRRHSLARDALLPLLAMMLAFVATQGAFSGLNWIAYGRATGVETNSAPFKETLAALQSVDAGPRIPYLPVSRQARFAIYAVSPSFRSLKDYFDPAGGKTPWQFGCSFYPATCGDIAGGWFMWALRDAVFTRGYYASPVKAAAFYRKLTAEVIRACGNHRLTCSTSPIALLPHISADQWRKLPASLLSGARQITDAQLPSLDPGRSSGNPRDIEADRAFLGNPVITAQHSEADTPEHNYHVAGWYRSPTGNWVSGQIEQTDGDTWIIPIARVTSPDLVAAFKDPGASQERFDFNIVCSTPCNLNFVGERGASIPLNLGQLVGQHVQYPLGAATLNIDVVSEHSAGALGPDIQIRAATAVRRFFGGAFSIVMPWLAAAGLLAMLIVAGVALFKRRLETISVLATAVWALLVSRLLLLGIVDISAFPGMITPYLSPAYVLVCVAVVLSFAALNATIRRMRELSRDS